MSKKFVIPTGVSDKVDDAAEGPAVTLSTQREIQTQMHDREHRYFVYLAASRTHVLYCGITNDIGRRMTEHREKAMPGFSAQYNCERLVWFQEFKYVGNAIDREKQIKNWRREKKIALIEEGNPTWADLSADWF